MDYTIPTDVQQLIAGQIAAGHYSTADEVLRDALWTLQEVEDDAAAVQAAIDDWRNGDEGLPLDEAFGSVRAEFHRTHPE
jgi:putative addiction module CopG family antidote